VVHLSTLSSPPQWQLPTGVTRGVWEYTQSDHIAQEYDEYFALNRLFEFDEQVLARFFRRTGLVVDLGCGTGRALIGLARHGFHGVAVDLSMHMLQIVAEKARLENLDIQGIQANLVELDCIADQSADYVICLFSTLGMIRGRDYRQTVLNHARRILKPGGLFVMHVHNFWFNLFDPLGRRWLLQHTLEKLRHGDMEWGDKFFHFHGIAQLFLHTFRQSELRKALKDADFKIHAWIPLDADRQRPLAHAWFFGRFRANGWIAVCE
jgi:ubiquinone/menaquinone biosynthesis C-methylase UbiE